VLGPELCVFCCTSLINLRETVVPEPWMREVMVALDLVSSGFCGEKIGTVANVMEMSS